MLALVPWPAHVREGDGPGFALDPAPRITADEPLGAVAEAFARELAAELGPRDSEPGGDGPESAEDGRIAFAAESGHGDEGYAVLAGADGVRIAASAPAGAFYATRTLLQLLQRSGSGAEIPAVEIRDAPRFAYRGLMLDVARHFHPVGDVEAVIDRAAGLKCNVLHLHLSDDQGWRIEIASRPQLTERASGTSMDDGPGGFYTREEYRHLVRYAAERHVTVIPEIDVPGHTHAVGLAYPELAAEPVLSEEIRRVTEEFGGRLPVPGEPYTSLAVGFSSLRREAEGLDDFLRDVFGELAGLTPGPYLHFGGDEALGTSEADYADLVSRAARIVAETGKTPVAWHEAGGAELPEGTLGQYWGFVSPTDGHDEKARGFVRGGGRLILSPADAIYLDMKYDDGTRLGLTWANGPTGVRESYAWDPASIIDGIAEEDVLGVEAALWSETLRGLPDIDAMLLPRLASAAESAWSPPLGSVPQRSWEAFRERIALLGPLWRRRGYGFFRSPEIPWRDR